MSRYQDTIKTLPVDNEPVDNMYIANSLFQEDPSVFATLASEFKETILIVVLFVLFSSEQMSELIKKYIPFARTSTFALVGIKSLFVIFLFYFIKNFQLIRKQ